MEEGAREDLERQAYEVEALLAIFEGDESVTVEVSGLEAARESIERGTPGKAEENFAVLVTFPTAPPRLELSSVRMGLPSRYPSQAIPVIELGSKFLTSKALARCQEVLETDKGNESLYQIVQVLLEVIDGEASEEPEASTSDVSGSLAREGEGGEEEQPKVEEGGSTKIEILHSEPYTERKSTFQAHLARVHSLEEVDEVMDALLSIKKVAACTHNMVAYRISIEGSGGLVQDFDDDGEAAAGSRLLHMLQAIDVVDLVVVVSRWYGGVKLGPSRFAIINNVARNHIKNCGLLPTEEEGKKKGGKGGNRIRT